MEHQAVSRHIAACLADTARLKNDILAMIPADSTRYPDEFEALSTGAALHAEAIACRLRHLIYLGTTVKKADYLAKAAEIHGIHIHYWGGVLEITLPALMPKRKYRQSTEFLSGPLYAALSRFAGSHRLPRFSESAVCFLHVYDRALPARRVRDHDNLEAKQVLDVVNAFVLADDTGLLCDVFHTSGWGKQSCTKVFVMERAGFPKWLSEYDF